jgi:hypothetical protein
MNNNRANIAIRRERIWQLVLDGMQTLKIAELLSVNRHTVSKDIKWMTKESQKYMNEMAKEMLPFKYKQSVERMEQTLYESWARYRLDGNMLALKLTLECTKEIASLCANGISIAAVKNITERANALGIGTV